MMGGGLGVCWNVPAGEWKFHYDLGSRCISLLYNESRARLQSRHVKNTTSRARTPYP